LIGHLQTNKVKLALELFDWIAAVDSLPVAEALSARRAAAGGPALPVLVEIKTAPEPTKHGILPSEAGDLVPRIARLPGLDVRGLMTVAPLGARPRPAFRALAGLRRELAGAGWALPHLSMGMSGDYETAVEEGATLVRIGTALFGPRSA
jgi:pyridoxal phosphate enzyme (YggS family)